MPYLQPQTVNLSFQGGLQSKTDALQLQPPALLELQNGLFDKTGQLNKRFGYTIFSQNTIGGNLISSAVAIDDFNNELNLFDNQFLYTYVAANQDWVNRATAISLVNHNSQIVRNSNQQINVDSATLNGITVYAWEDTRGGVRYSVIDQATGAYCVSDQLVSGVGIRPKCLAALGKLYIFYNDQLNNLYYQTINPANPGLITAPIDVVADTASNCNYDITASPAGNIYFAYNGVHTGNPTVVIGCITSGGVTIGATITLAAGHTVPCISVVYDSKNQLWISYVENFGGTLAILQSLVFSITNATTFTVVQSQVTIDEGNIVRVAAIESLSPGALQLVYEFQAVNSYNQSVRSATLTNNGILTVVGNQLSVGIASKPFRFGNNIYINTTFQSTLQSTYFIQLISSPPFTIVGKVSPDLGGGLRTSGLLPEVSILSPGVFQWPNLVKGQFISEDNVSFTLLGVNSTITDFTSPNKFNSTTFSNNLLFVGGILQMYDGQSVVEQNFHLFPENILTVVTPSGGALSVGQYQYQVVYAWTDKFGQVQYSTPSSPITVTITTVDSSVSLIIPTLRLTAKTGVVVKIYRTQVNGTVFQEVTSELAPLFNSTSVNNVTFTDTAADVQIAANQTIYTTGGVLSNAAPPSCSLISLYQDRVMISGLEDPNQIWFSKNHINNQNSSTIPVEFSAFLTINIDPTSGPGRTGPITAITQMNGNLIIFKESAIYLLSGDGPNDEGGGDQFPAAQLVTQSVGCTNPNSIVLTDQGLFFQSPDKGIWLLNLSLGPPTYVGAGVDDQGKQYTVSGAVGDPHNNLIIFTTFNGPALVYDYYIQQWATWTNHQAQDAIVFGGLFTFVKSNGQVYQQNRSIFYDGILDGYAVPISLEFTTPWISINSTLGYMSIIRGYILGQYRGQHLLNISVGYNMDPAFTKTGQINPQLTAGSNVWGADGYWGQSTPWGSTWQPYMYQFNMPIQKCTSFRLKFSDTSIAPFNEGFTANALRFELGQLSGSVKLPATNKVGLQ